MRVKQISVFLENNSGRLAEVTRVLAEQKIDLKAVSIADTADFGILRLVCETPEKALSVLKEHRFTARVTEVIGIKLNNTRGSLSDVLHIFEEHSINIEYLYSTLMAEDNRVVIIFKTGDIDRGLRILQERGLDILSAYKD